MLKSLLLNASLLIAIGTLFNLLYGLRKKSKTLFYVIVGIVFGVSAIAGMNIPYHYAPGIIYDGRSIILIVAGLFGGPVSAAIAVLVASVYRISLGGPGVIAGVTTILGTALTGLLVRRYYNNNPLNFTITVLFVAGLLGHVVMLASQLLIIPIPSGWNIVKQIWLPVMTIFPVATVLLGLILLNEEKRSYSENLLSREREKLKLITDNVTDVVWLTDLNFKPTFISPSVTNLLGFSVEEYLKLKAEDLYPPETLNRIIKWLAEEFEEDNKPGADKSRSRIYEIQQFRKDGSLIELSVNVRFLRNEYGEPVGLIGVSRDITEKKKNERVKELLYDVSRISAAEIGLAEFASHIHREIKKILKADNFYIALYDKETDLYKFIYHKDKYDDYEVNKPISLKGGLTDYVRQNAKAGLISSSEDKKLIENGTVNLVGHETVIWMGAPIINSANGEVIGVIALQDYEAENAYTEDDLRTLEIIASQLGLFLERVKILEELKIAKDKAELSDRLKTEFMAQMSHEIRTPINIITGSMQLIKEELPESKNSEIEELFDSINIAAARIIRTIDMILNYSELQTDSYEANFKIIDLEEILKKKLLGEFRIAAQSKGINLKYECNAKNTKIRGDEYSVHQIFANLVDNAIKYTHDGEVKITVTETENKIKVEVSDTGIGMSEEFMKKLFDPFTQEETGYTRLYDGNGLGLALVQKYCQLNKAVIDVKSKKGEGSVFSVLLNKAE
ncbi:LytS/YhcK type 5TM receptor domain-containing protein [Melioribacter sp. Ez-97]|uniref:LytS/YhcK type 5TM receptor domain-containing protein n=1 Tax=Melioribacter sp. Ez-97 TaxID=3423434 RepID=UPI003ED90554